MICFASTDSLRFIGISNKSASFYSLNMFNVTVDLDLYCLKHELDMNETRKAKLVQRLETAFIPLPITHLNNCLNFDLMEEPEYPMVQVKDSSPGHGKGIFATVSLKPGKSLFGAPVAPYVSMLQAEYCSQRCFTCFRPLDAYPIIPCKGCTEGFCSEKCRDEGSYHLPICNQRWTLALPLLVRLGLACHIKAARDVESAIEPIDLRIRGPIGTLDSRDIQKIYAPDISIIRGLLTNEEKMDFMQTLLYHCLDVVFISQLVDPSFVKINSRDLLSDILRCYSNGFQTLVEAPDNSENTELVESLSTISIGFCLYGIPSLLNHNCEPNVANQYYDKSNQIIFRTRTSIQSGQELFHCYGVYFLTVPVETRRNQLKKQFLFDCHCKHCRNDMDVSRKLDLRSELELSTFLQNAIINVERSRGNNSKLVNDLDVIIQKEMLVEGQKQNLSPEPSLELHRRLMIQTTLLAVRKEKYGLMFELMSGRGFDNKTEKLLPLRMPDSFPLQRGIGQLCDSICQTLVAMKRDKEALEYLEMSIQILEYWYPPNSIEVVCELQKSIDLGSIIGSQSNSHHTEEIKKTRKIAAMRLAIYGNSYPLIIEQRRRDLYLDLIRNKRRPDSPFDNQLFDMDKDLGQSPRYYRSVLHAPEFDPTMEILGHTKLAPSIGNRKLIWKSLVE
jgi:hypothetical protein